MAHDSSALVDPALMRPLEQWLDRMRNEEQALSASSEKVYRAMWRSLSRALNRPTWLGLGAQDVERVLSTLNLRAQPRRRYLQLMARVLGETSSAAEVLAQATLPFRKLPVTLQHAEERVLLAALPELELRDQALVLLYLGGGLRTSEAVALRRDEVFLDEDVPWVAARHNGDGAPDRAVPLTLEATERLREWLETHDDPFVFPGRENGHLAAGSAWRICRRFLSRHVERTRLDLSPRRLRHTFAVRQLAAGESLPTLSKWMGHRRVETTAKLLHLVTPSKQPV